VGGGQRKKISLPVAAENVAGVSKDAPATALQAGNQDGDDPPRNSLKTASGGGVNGGVTLEQTGGVNSGDELDDLLSELRAVPPGAKLYQKEHHGNFYAVYRWFENRIAAGIEKRVRPMRYVAPVQPKRITKRKLTNDDHKEIKSNSRKGARGNRQRGAKR
jgi:hypothetical protein